MNEGPPESIDGYRLPVFRLVGADGECDPELCQALAEEISRRGLRPLAVRLSAGRRPVTAPDLQRGGLLRTGVDRLELSCSPELPLPGIAPAARSLSLLADLCQRYDVVLATGDWDLPLNTLLIATGATAGPVAENHFRVADPAWGTGRVSDLLLSWLELLCREEPVWACVLIGGRSSRMGRPKHLLRTDGGVTWLEMTVARLHALADGVVLAGAGEIPLGLSHLTRLPDVPGVAGPLAGILAAMRWQPGVSWLVVACDLPSLTEEAVRWLLDARRPGRWAIIPRRSRDSHVEPLLACYDRRCLIWFEELRLTGSLRIGMVARRPQVHSPVI
ncbi:MAG: molybdenum cofactor guanylyltransferase, partial [Desulfobulbaceae bacterium]